MVRCVVVEIGPQAAVAAKATQETTRQGRTHDTADEGRDEGDASLGAGDGLAEAEEEGEVAVDALLLEVAGGLDALPGRGDLDENAVLVDADRLVESDQGLGLEEVAERAGGR